MFSITRVFFFILQITVLLESFVVGVTQAGIKNNPNNHEKFGTHQKFAMEPQDQTAVVGSRVTLPCRVVAKSGQLQWTKDDFGLGDHRTLIGFERYTMVGSDDEGDYSLDIFPIMLDDDAVYQCQVGPGRKSEGIRSRKAKLTVLVPPDNPRITQGNHIVTTEDREIELECASKGGKPPAEITWIDGLGNVMKDGIEYFHQQMENSKLFEARSILKFIPKKEHHNTTITCQAQNTADRTYKSARLKLEVKFAPKVTVSVISGALANGRIQEGAEVRLACHAEANPPEVNFKWFINDNKISGDHSTELIIPNITRDFHDSIVKCEVSNNVGKSMDSETIDISYAPYFKTRPQSVEADVGTSVTLSCEVEGNPVPEIVWIYDGLDRVVASTTNLTIIVSHDTVGRYLCKASVPGFPDIIEQATVYLKGPPTISSARRQFGTPGEMSRVECIAFSIPKARHVGWTFNGKEINITNDVDEFTIEEEQLPFGIKSTLMIQQSRMGHFGRYNCTVINDYGYDVLEIELNGESKYNSQLFFACFGGAISFVCLVIVVLAWLMCIKKTKKKLPPADVIPSEQNYKGCKGESDCSSNKSDMKINRENEYLESYSANDLGATKIPLNTFTMPLGGQIPDFRYSGDFGDSFGQMQTTKLGINNNGYIPYVDYNRDYTPPPTTLNHVKTTNASLSNHLIMCTSTAAPTITSASIVGISTGTITNGTYSLTRNRPLDRLINENPTSIPNGLMTNHHSLHVNVDPRYSTLNFGTSYLKQSHHSPLASLNTANATQTPAPPPYHLNSGGSRGSNSNSSFSSSTTISNINGVGGGSVVGISNGGGSIASQTPSPSGQFIVPANTKIGALATHV